MERSGGGFADHFSKVANHYVVFRPRYPRALFEWLAGLCRERQLAWDCATGSGQAATGLAEFFEQVIATDASEDQIANAMRHPKVEYRAAAAESSGLASGRIDLITVAQAAHWLDLERFYMEARRVAKSEAVLAIWCYGEMRFGEQAVDQVLDHYYHKVVGPYWPPNRRYIEEDYRTVPFPFREIDCPRFDLNGEFTFEQLAGYLRTWSATQRYIEAVGKDPVREVEEKLRPDWPEGFTRRTAQWTIHVRAARLLTR